MLCPALNRSQLRAEATTAAIVCQRPRASAQLLRRAGGRNFAVTSGLCIRLLGCWGGFFIGSAEIRAFGSPGGSPTLLYREPGGKYFFKDFFFFFFSWSSS